MSLCKLNIMFLSPWNAILPNRKHGVARSSSSIRKPAIRSLDTNSDVSEVSEIYANQLMVMLDIIKFSVHKILKYTIVTSRCTIGGLRFFNLRIRRLLLHIFHREHI